MSTTASAPRPAGTARRTETPDHRHQVVIIGGGSAGLTVAARLRRRRPDLDVAVVEPSDRHFYQPLWTLAGAGVVARERTVRPQRAVTPKGVTWLREAVAAFEPDRNQVRTDSGRTVAYDALVVAPGIQVDWDAVAGLPQALGRDGVASNWSYESVASTWEFLRGFRGGTALFTLPATPVKCPGAAQKIMYLADDHLRRAGLRDRSRIVFASAAGSIFAVERYARTLRQVLQRKGIETLFQHNLVEVRGRAKEAVLEHVATGERTVLPYDFLHVTPPQGAPDVVSASPLTGAGGWVAVDRHTLRHEGWGNVFALGDASSLPTAKTAAAVRHQARVVVANLLAVLAGTEPAAAYDGYTACPIVTGYRSLVLAEFDYDGQPRETFPFDQSKERYSMYLLKRYALPALYWHGMLRGRA